MEEVYTIPLSQLEKEFSFERIYVPEDYETVLVRTPEVSRPGLALAGFYGIFDRDRIQIIGNAEHKYLQELSPAAREQTLIAFVKSLPVAILFTTGNEVFPELIRQAQISGVPVLRSQEHTSPVMAALIASLNQHLAPRITRHGVLVEVYGEGVLLLGDSGVGKSETAIELINRGHRLIADDAVEIKRVSAITLVGSAPELIRHYIELRGVGVINVAKLYGMGAVKAENEVFTYE